MYAKMTIYRDGYAPYIKLVASEFEECINYSDLCTYVYTGAFDEYNVDNFLKETKPTVLFATDDIVKYFTVGFYRKYANILKVEY